MTGFSTEETRYESYYARDVNNYFAKCDSGKVKRKGIFAETGLKKAPGIEVCFDAVINYIYKGVPIKTTIDNCTDITKFLVAKNVTGGALEGETDHGKVIRWYYAKSETKPIRYKVNGHKVASSDSGRVCMTLPETLPDDIDYDFYVKYSEKLLESICANQK